MTTIYINMTERSPSRKDPPPKEKENSPVDVKIRSRNNATINLPTDTEEQSPRDSFWHNRKVRKIVSRILLCSSAIALITSLSGAIIGASHPHSVATEATFWGGLGLGILLGTPGALIAMTEC